MIHFHGRWIFNKHKMVKLYMQTFVHLVLFVFVLFSSHLSSQKLGCNFPAHYWLVVLHSQLTVFPVLLYFSEDWYNYCSAIKLCLYFLWWGETTGYWAKTDCYLRVAFVVMLPYSWMTLSKSYFDLTLDFFVSKKKYQTRLNLKLLSPLKCCAIFPDTWQLCYKAIFWWAVRFPMSPQVPNRNFLRFSYSVKI